MKTNRFANHRSASSDLDLVLAVERARGLNRRHLRERGRWPRELWSAYVPEPIGPPSEAPPPSLEH